MSKKKALYRNERTLRDILHQRKPSFGSHENLTMRDLLVCHKDFPRVTEYILGVAGLDFIEESREFNYLEGRLHDHLMDV